MARNRVFHHHQLSTTHFFFSFFVFSFLPAFASHVTDHTDTYRFLTHTTSATFEVIHWIRQRIHLAGFSLTWICKHALILDLMGSLSAACVLKIPTHSLSGAMQSRQHVFPAFWAIARDPDRPNDNFFFFNALSC